MDWALILVFLHFYTFFHLQGPFKKYRDWFAVSSMEWWMGVRLVSSIVESPITQVHFSSVVCEHALRQEMDFVTCDFLWCLCASMERTAKQHYTVKFCFELGKSVSETFEPIKQAYGDDTLSCTRGFEWHKMFKEGQELVKDWTETAQTDAQVAKAKKVLDSDFFLFRK